MYAHRRTRLLAEPRLALAQRPCIPRVHAARKSRLPMTATYQTTLYTPALSDVRAMMGRGNIVPIYREVPADLETPVSAYLKVARGEYSFLLESVEGGERVGALQLHRHRALPRRARGAARRSGDPLDRGRGGAGALQAGRCARPAALPRRRRRLPRLRGGALLRAARWRRRSAMSSASPKSWFMFTDTLLVFDHLQHKIKVVSHFRLDGDIEAAYRQAVWQDRGAGRRASRSRSSALPYRAGPWRPPAAR